MEVQSLQKIFMSIYQVIKIINLFLTVCELKVHKSFIKGFMTTHILEMSHSIFICLYEIYMNRLSEFVVPVWWKIRERLLVTVVTWLKVLYRVKTTIPYHTSGAGMSLSSDLQ